MGKDNLTSGLELEALGKLFRICSEKEQKDKALNPNQERAELLLDHLARTIQLEHSKNVALSEDIKHLSEISGISSGTTIRDLLTNSETDLILIRKLKDTYKRLAQSENSKAEKDVASAIYYAAIGHAIIYEGTRITSFSYKELSEYFSKFSQVKWISQDLCFLFKKAHKNCHKKMETDYKNLK
jgi:hypothetical protein